MTWRVGRKVGRTLYEDDTLVGMMDSSYLATLVVEAVNDLRARATGGLVLVPADSLPLLNENTRLRAEVAAHAAGVAEERARVVAFLRHVGRANARTVGVLDCAFRIELGEHHGPGEHVPAGERGR
jgi:hypothetical protein